MTTPPEEEKYNRWELQDPSLLDFGYFSSQSPPSQNGGYYITTAINYTNGPAHMGHAYEAATADALARFHRLFEPTYFVTGSDEHGQKVANMATEGQSPIDICNKAGYNENVYEMNMYSYILTLLFSVVVCDWLSAFESTHSH
jgi:methionyl-tRNA synthetase